MCYTVHLSAINEVSKNSLSKDSFFCCCFLLLFLYKQQICFSVLYKDTYGQVAADSYLKTKNKKKGREMHATKAEKPI